MVHITVEIPDEVAMELNAHIAMFKAKLHLDIRVEEMVLSAITGYLIEHANEIEEYRIAHESPKRREDRFGHAISEDGQYLIRDDHCAECAKH